MDVSKVLMEYDGMFGTHSLEKIDEFLTEKITEAMEEQDYGSAVTLMNEMMGFCRDTSQNEKGLHYCELVITMFDKLKMTGTLAYATSMLNVANAYRAFGLFDKSQELFVLVENIYKEQLPKGEFHYASLYNNWSLLYQEIGDFVQAREMLKRALVVVDAHPNAVIEQANTRTNLAATLLRITQDSKAYEQAVNYLEEALAIFEKDGGRDFHYGAALAAMGDALFMGDSFGEAAAYYKRAMDELMKHVGKTEAYERVEANYHRALKRAELAEQKEESDMSAQADTTNDVSVGMKDKHKKKSNLESCREFYETYGAPMIHEKFPEYESRIAVGFAGEGSDCYGFEDDISVDHDYGIGFCMWLTDSDYEAIGITLHHAYEQIVEAYGGEQGVSYNKLLNGRRGVCTIGAFYERILGVRIDESDLVEGHIILPTQTWLTLDEDRFAEATNGTVFRDDTGIFSAIRGDLLAYYPEQVWQLRLSKALHDFAQYGQSNYARMMARQDYVTAKLCISRGAESAMSLAYLLNRTYAPYYKWMRKGMDGLCVLKGVRQLVDTLILLPLQKTAWAGYHYDPYKINMQDAVVRTFEQIAGLVSEELREQGIVHTTETYLDVQSQIVMNAAYGQKVNMQEVGRIMDQEKTLVDQIVELEWKQFDKVKNEGGRADCQDDWNTFSIMRRSQYLTWNEELLSSYLNDLQDADAKGWNLIMEKYARMMQSTAKERYAELEKDLPKRSKERQTIAEEIIKIQVTWMEEFAKKYPKMAGNARSIHTYEDSEYNTSYETYLRGELGTYSEETFVLYGRFIADIARKGENLAYNIMNQTAKLYGYDNVEDAESRL
ncbi:MAG: DUF4125 family protein [Lachnospiraceae bacterium]|nr:DUF4125 family protein [Lachnospiraceae bacterium]